MTIERITSAGRLLREITRIKQVVVDSNPFFSLLPELFGFNGEHWSRGVFSYTKLCDQFVEEALTLGGGRTDRYRQAGEACGQIVEPKNLPVSALNIVDAHLGELTIERLESADELLLAAGMSIEIDRERLRQLRDQLADIEQEISQGPSSEFDGVLLGKIREILFVLDRYDLFGSLGVEAAVSDLVGRASLARFYGVPMSEVTISRLKKTFGIAKSILDIVVYSKSGVEALEWSGAIISGILPSP